MTAATARGFPQIASGYAAQAAFAEVLYRYGRPPLAPARSVGQTATAFEPQLRARFLPRGPGRMPICPSSARRGRNFRA